MSAVELADVDAPAAGVAEGPVAAELLRRLTLTGGLLAAAEAVGAAGRLLEDARTLRGRAAPVRPDDRQLPGAAPHPGGHVRAPGEHVVDRPLRGRRPRRRPGRGGPDGRGGEGVRLALAPARSRTARCRSSAASPSPQEHPAHRFLRRIVVREQQFGDAAHHERELGRALAADAAGRQQRTTGDGRPRRFRSTDGRRQRMAQTIGFNDPTAQRLERVTTGADPGHRRPAAGGRPARSALAGVRRRARLRRQVEPHLSRGLATRARSSSGALRSGTSFRPPTTWSASTRVLAALDGTAVPVPRALYLGDADGPLGSALLRDGARARPHLPQRPPRRLCRRARAAPGDRRGPRRHARRPPHRRPGGGRPGGVRPARRLHGAPAAPLVEAVGGDEDRRAAGARRAARRSAAWAAARARARDRARRLPARQHDPAPDATGLGSSPSSTGR